MSIQVSHNKDAEPASASATCYPARDYEFGSLFSGIGGIDLGLERAGWKCAWQVEIDDYASRVLAKHWPDVERHRDVREVGAHNLRPVQLIAGGFPCQDISNAGHQAGIEGERSGLWREFHRIICELRPDYAVVENVAALLVRGIDRVLGDLAASGYDAEWCVLPACAFGAPHTRERVFILAYPARSGWAGAQDSLCILNNKDDAAARAVEALSAGRRPRIRRREWWDSEPAVDRVAHGIPTRLVGWKLRRLGNAVVPQIAEWIGSQILRGCLKSLKLKNSFADFKRLRPSGLI